jgi:hypothetical protein
LSLPPIDDWEHLDQESDSNETPVVQYAACPGRNTGPSNIGGFAAPALKKGRTVPVAPAPEKSGGLSRMKKNALVGMITHTTGINRFMELAARTSVAHTHARTHTGLLIKDMSLLRLVITNMY